MQRLVDHGLPLIQLKELRRELVIALGGSVTLRDRDKFLEIAALQQTIEAVEAVIADLDAELEKA